MNQDPEGLKHHSNENAEFSLLNESFHPKKMRSRNQAKPRGLLGLEQELLLRRARRVLMKTLISALFLFISTANAQPQIPSGFCWAKVEDRTLCTPIFPIPDQEILNMVCMHYAHSLETQVYGSFLNPDLEALIQIQKETCDPL